MSAERFFFWIVGGLFGIIFTRWGEKYRVAELKKANEELLERIATVTGQLADERARYALRVKRAHDGAIQAAKTKADKRKADPMRINLDQQRTAAQDLPEGGPA